jgi:hypothetical protein
VLLIREGLPLLLSPVRVILSSFLNIILMFFDQERVLLSKTSFSVVSPLPGGEMAYSPSICNVISMAPALEGLPHTLSHVSDCCVSFLHNF